MKKEYLIVTAAALFLLSYGLDFLAGSVSISVNNPLEFFDPKILTTYPLTAVEIIMRALGLVLAIHILVDEIEDRAFIKAAAAIFIGVLAIFYAIQQLGTGGHLTPFQWTLAFAYGGFGLLILSVYYVFRGVMRALFKGLSGGQEREEETENV